MNNSSPFKNPLMVEIIFVEIIFVENDAYFIIYKTIIPFFKE